MGDIVDTTMSVLMQTAIVASVAIFIEWSDVQGRLGSKLRLGRLLQKEKLIERFIIHNDPLIKKGHITKKLV
jgi:hypothetical protein